MRSLKRGNSLGNLIEVPMKRLDDSAIEDETILKPRESELRDPSEYDVVKKLKTLAPQDYLIFLDSYRYAHGYLMIYADEGEVEPSYEYVEYIVSILESNEFKLFISELDKMEFGKR
jgi:hypothetical protein